MTPSVSDLLSAYYSVYPVSGEYANQGERLSIAAVLRVVAQQIIEEIDPVESIIRIAEELEQF